MPSVPQVVMKQVGGSYRSWDDPAIVASNSSFALTAQDATLTYGASGVEEWLNTDFAGFASLNAMMTSGGGPFSEREVQNDATWTLANTTDYLGNTKQCLRFDLYRNEDLALLAFDLPGITYGLAGSGKDTIFYRWREKRSSNTKFLADKSSRVVSKYGGAGGSAYIDVLTAFNGNGVSGASSTRTLAFGQANVNDSNYIDEAYVWPVDTWRLFEVEIILGTVNGGDSRYRYWIDGVLVDDATGFSILEGVVQGGTANHKFQQFRLGGWESGGTSTNFLNGGAAESRWYDDLYIGNVRPS